jgi:alpha-L-arabinofuranosidase
MKPLRLTIGCILLFFTQTNFAAGSNEPDSVYLFSYATNKNQNHNGLHFAWSRDKITWYSIGNEYGFVKSDYGRWGSEKKMFDPYLIKGSDNQWHCVWSLNDRENIFAAVSSPDLVYWGRQDYPLVKQGTNCLRPVIKYDEGAKRYTITYIAADNKYYRTTTGDFKTYSAVTEVSSAQYINSSVIIQVDGVEAKGQLHYVPWTVADKLIKTWELKQFKNNQNNETTLQDSVRFAGLKPVEATITLQPQHKKPISDLLLGIFFEDINYAADGGLYAELIQNRDFEYALSDKQGRDKDWTSTHSWTVKGDNMTFTIDSASPIHSNNPHYAVLETKTPGAALVNSGFDGIVIKKGEKYNLSLFTKGKGQLLVRLVSKDNKTLAQTKIALSSSNWKNNTAVLVSSADATDAKLELQPLAKSIIALDMISLFPQNTFKGRKNGLRADLAQTIADIRPRFIRFPGGCVAHGDGLDNIYRWKNSIGPLEARKPQRNLWGYHQTAGLGYFEYFQYCEDIGAEPLPVVAAAVPCQNSGTSATGGGQQGGIPMNEMDEYIREVIDLIEYANGDATTKWGRKRAEAGHPKPFNLKYIGIGNEDLISDVFEERFTIIYNAVKKAHPEVTIIGTAGPFFEGTDYEEGWGIANKLNVPMIDEHYYQTPGWFINNQEFYDRYDRSKSKVYLGEYAAHLPGRPNNLETALAEALYLTALERNGDVVAMSSYAPLLAKEGHTQWNPDLIYFNNSEVKPTVGYHVQKLYGLNAGNEYLPSLVNLSNTQEAVKKRIGLSVVRDTKTNDLIVKLVNLLPVSVNTTLDLNGISVIESQATKTVLAGRPADKNSKPVESVVSLTDKTKLEIPAYSFTVIRVKTILAK